MRVVLVGAGVAGGVIARGLRRIPDVEVLLIEQVSADDHANAGNGLNIGPNALWALDKVLPEVAAELRGGSLPWTRWHAGLADGTPLHVIPLADVAACSGIRIRWSELYRIARERVADVTRYDTRCTGVDFGADGKPAITVERMPGGGPETIAGIDLLIACDGRYSRVREGLCGPPSIRQLGVANFRLLIADDGAIAIDDLEQWYHGPGRLLGFRLADGRLYLSGNFALEPGAEIAEHQKTSAYLREAYLPAVGAVEPKCAALVEATCARLAALHWSRAQEIDMRFHDRSGQVLFVGDSAHAMAPTLGQGATQAVEDGCAFLSLFQDLYGRRGFSVAAFTAAYDRLRRDRIEFVRRFSWDASDSLLIGSDPVVTNREKTTPGYQAKLRRMYCDLGFGPAATAAA